MRLKKVTWTYLDLTTDFILVGTVMAALSANDDNMFASEYLLFAKQAGWVLKSKIFGQNLTYSMETTVHCESIRRQKVSNSVFQESFETF